jgi:hypothetical protein
MTCRIGRWLSLTLVCAVGIGRFEPLGIFA